MKVLAGLRLRAVPQLLTVCRARCVTKAFQRRRSSCMPCTATASWERRLPRTVQVCQALLLCVCSLCSSPFPVTCRQVLQPCPSWDIWCVACHVGRFVHHLVPSLSWPGELPEVPVFPACPAQRHLVFDRLRNLSRYLSLGKCMSRILPQDLALDALSSTHKTLLLCVLLRTCRESASGRKWQAPEPHG